MAWRIGLRSGDVILAVNRQPVISVDELSEEGLPVLEPCISSSVKVRESHQEAKPLPYLAPAHKLSGQFAELWHSIQNGAK